MPDISLTLCSAASTLLLTAGTVALGVLGRWLLCDEDTEDAQ